VLLVLSPNQQFLLTKQRLIAFVIIILVFSLNNTSFSWYLLNYTNENKPLESLLLGLILGGGIGLSVAILLYFFLDWVRNRFSTTTPLIFLFLFAAGQLIRGIKLLAQVDLWPETPLLFNFSGWLPAQSILAPLFSVIFGYQERMTQLNVAVYILALVLPIILFKRSKHEI